MGGAKYRQQNKYEPHTYNSNQISKTNTRLNITGLYSRYRGSGVLMNNPVELAMDGEEELLLFASFLLSIGFYY